MVKRIAAGEVVERPSSVVKELLENSLDAGSSLIQVLIEDGGKKLVEVRDNGCGMSEDEALLAIERHTTSKIASEEDLCRIGTLGFRGEALYAISSVSRFVLATRREEDELATKLVVEGGVLKSVEKVYRDGKGTTVRVENLFFNLRARRKFLRSRKVEREHVRRIIREYALAYPDVSFEYHEEGERIFSYVADSLFSRIGKVVGKVEGSGEWGCAKVFVSPNGKGETFVFVNKRAVSDRSISYLVRGILKQSYLSWELPSVVVFLDLPPEDVDVNVHPTKREVRFRNKAKVLDDVERALKEASKPQSYFTYGVEKENFLSDVSNGHFYDSKEPVQEVVKDLSCKLLRYRFIGEVSGIFMLFEDREDGSLVMVDKHALHERMLFDRMLKREISSHPVFVPLDIDAFLFKDLLERLGFAFDDEGRVLLKVPSWAYGKEAKVLRELVLELEDAPLDRGYEELARRACRAAVRAGDISTSLDAEDVARILENVPEEELTCPHGRPVVVRLDKAKLEALFKRRM